MPDQSPAFAPGPFTDAVRAGPFAVRGVDGSPVSAVRVEHRWHDGVLSATLVNAGTAPVDVGEILLASGDVALPADTPVYAEGFQMLSQYEGTAGEVVLLGGLSDAEHYRLPQHVRADDGRALHTAYNLAVFGDTGTGHALVGFTSCRRFSGQVRFAPGYIEVALDAEGRLLGPGERWRLEDLFVAEADDLDDLLAAFAGRITANHPRPVATVPGTADQPPADQPRADQPSADQPPAGQPQAVPTGWCSWYCFGPDVTTHDVARNIEALPQIAPAGADGQAALRFVLVDDGYQARMGDWFDPAPGMPDLAAICRLAAEHGCEPAIWVAPFIAEAGATVLREHPDWFVHDHRGLPLPSAAFTFGGWRNGPWYCLDGTHPGARRHLREVFARMRAQWGFRYFKLDAQMWGTFAAGVRHDPTRTAVEAYRMAMSDVLDEVSPDGVLIGCNAPMWPSLGLVHAMRVTGDIARNWQTIRSVAREGLRRGWQHARLWLNDPDCLLAGDSTRTVVAPDGSTQTRTSTLPAAEASLLAAYIRATGGLVLSGDDLTGLAEDRLQMLRACLPPTGVSARFGDTDYRLGVASSGAQVDAADSTEYIALNWTDHPVQVRLPASAPGVLIDRLRGSTVATSGTGEHRTVPVPARSGLILASTDKDSS